VGLHPSVKRIAGPGLKDMFGHKARPDAFNIKGGVPLSQDRPYITENYLWNSQLKSGSSRYG